MLNDMNTIKFTESTIWKLSYLFILFTFLSGCVIHPQTNIQLSGIQPHQPEFKRDADTIVIARLISNIEYARTYAKKNWRNHYRATTLEVLSVEKGHWSDKQIVYRTSYISPTPKSGIVIDLAADFSSPPTYPARIWALYLDTKSNPSALIGYENRSLVPPHDKLPIEIFEPVDFSKLSPVQKDERQKLWEQIQKPVEEYAAKSGFKPIKDYYYGQTEQTDNSYIIQIVFKPMKGKQFEVHTLKVTKPDYKVSLLWSVKCEKD